MRRHERVIACLAALFATTVVATQEPFVAPPGWPPSRSSARTWAWPRNSSAHDRVGPAGLLVRVHRGIGLLEGAVGIVLVAGEQLHADARQNSGAILARAQVGQAARAGDAKSAAAGGDAAGRCAALVPAGAVGRASRRCTWPRRRPARAVCRDRRFCARLPARANSSGNTTREKESKHGNVGLCTVGQRRSRRLVWRFHGTVRRPGRHGSRASRPILWIRLGW